jgi:LmbE family N-acetylglucosaminyl deacetylase
MARRCILAVYSHPDDETTVTAGTFMRYAQEGVEVYVITATRGEWGALGSGGMVLTREELPAVREAELLANLKTYGVNPPLVLDYIDGTLKDADIDEHVGLILAEMKRVKPDVVITWGPTGISHHDDHIATSQATDAAFKQYLAIAEKGPRLFYVAVPKNFVEEFDLDVDGPEANATVEIDITANKATKIQGLRNYKSQEDSQEVAAMMETEQWGAIEMFHQVYPPVTKGVVSTGFWD